MASLSIPPAGEADGLGAACCAIAAPDNAPDTRRAQIIFLVFINYLNEITDHYEFCLTTIGASSIYNAKFNICQYNWTLEDEIIQINSFDIGIMPLVNTPWENGKCGFKLIQYMACGVPVIASPVGINSQIVTNEVGFLANCKEDWIKYISVFIENKILREEMGIKSRIRIENDFSFNSNINIFKNYFTKL